MACFHTTIYRLTSWVSDISRLSIDNSLELYYFQKNWNYVSKHFSYLQNMSKTKMPNKVHHNKNISNWWRFEDFWPKFWKKKNKIILLSNYVQIMKTPNLHHSMNLIRLSKSKFFIAYFCLNWHKKPHKLCKIMHTFCCFYVLFMYNWRVLHYLSTL